MLLIKVTYNPIKQTTLVINQDKVKSIFLIRFAIINIVLFVIL